MGSGVLFSEVSERTARRLRVARQTYRSAEALATAGVSDADRVSAVVQFDFAVETVIRASAILNEAWKTPAWGTLLWVVMVTGCRRGELCALRWSDIDLERGKVAIDSALTRKLREKATKSEQDRRLSIDPYTVDLLRAHKKANDEQCRSLGMKLTGDSYVFSLEPDFSAPMKPDTVERRHLWCCRRSRGGTGVVSPGRPWPVSSTAERLHRPSGGGFLAGRGDDEPQSAEALDVVTLHLVLALVGVEVQRMSAVCDLDVAVSPLRRTHQGLLHRAERRGWCLRQHRRPGLRACAIACRGR